MWKRQKFGVENASPVALSHGPKPAEKKKRFGEVAKCPHFITAIII